MCVTRMDRIRVNMYKRKFMYIRRGLGVMGIAWKIRENTLRRFGYDVQGKNHDEIVEKNL